MVYFRKKQIILISFYKKEIIMEYFFTIGIGDILKIRPKLNYKYEKNKFIFLLK